MGVSFQLVKKIPDLLNAKATVLQKATTLRILSAVAGISVAIFFLIDRRQGRAPIDFGQRRRSSFVDARMQQAMTDCQRPKASSRLIAHHTVGITAIVLPTRLAHFLQNSAYHRRGISLQRQFAAQLGSAEFAPRQ